MEKHVFNGFLPTTCGLNRLSSAFELDQVSQPGVLDDNFIQNSRIEAMVMTFDTVLRDSFLFPTDQLGKFVTTIAYFTDTVKDSDLTSRQIKHEFNAALKQLKYEKATGRFIRHLDHDPNGYYDEAVAKRIKIAKKAVKAYFKKLA